MGEAASEDAFLANVQDEVNAVRDCFDAAGAQVLNEPAAHTTLAEMQSFLESTPAHVLHMACHGVQEQRPMESSFVLHDGRLTIERIMALNLPHAVLAFLSACETAKGSKEHPDQAIHLAASMLFCGFRSVIGTLWCVTPSR
jgi:CHAT domain-containing protein